MVVRLEESIDALERRQMIQSPRFLQNPYQYWISYRGNTLITGRFDNSTSNYLSVFIFSFVLYRQKDC
jgi:hypothetical protein